MNIMMNSLIDILLEIMIKKIKRIFIDDYYNK